MYAAPFAFQSAPSLTPPVFVDPSYSFNLREDAPTGTLVGQVSAMDDDLGDVIEYSITHGNEAGKFDVNSSTGQITVAGTLDYDTDSSYALTVQAADETDGTATVMVNIAVLRLPLAPAPSFVSVDELFSSDTEFSLDWDDVDGAASYEYQYSVVDNQSWEGLGETYVSAVSFEPSKGIFCGLEYFFHVRT